MIKLFDPFYDKKEEESIIEVLKSNFWASGAGTGKVSKFEKEFKDYLGCKGVVAVNSGTAALHLALNQVNVESREVLVPALTFVSTVSNILMCGAKPVFVDVDETTLCMDPNDLKKKKTEKCKAIIPVHFGGMPCDLDKLSNFAEENKLTIIEDAAHASGAKFNRKRIGQHSSYVCFSFHPVKNLAMPTGGAIAINGDNYLDEIKKLKSERWCGIDNREGLDYDVPRIGWNYYMNEFSAAIGLCQLRKLEWMNKKRKEIAKKYFNEINLEKKMPYNEESSYHLYWIRTKNRDKFIKKMNDSGIEVGIHYKPVNKMTYFANTSKLKITEMVGKEIVTLPIHPNLTDEDIEKIISKVNQFSA